MAYVSVEDLATYLGISENTDDALFAILLSSAQGIIDAYCGQTFEASANSTRHFLAMDACNGGAVDGRDLILDAPLCAITSVTNGNGVVVAAASYNTLPLNTTPYYALRLKVSSGLYWTYDDDAESDSIAIVGKWAYSTSAGDVIQHVCTRLAAFLYYQRENGLDLDRIIQTAGGVAIPPDLPRDAMKLLGPYRRAV